MKVEYTKLAQPLAHDPRRPLEVTMTAEKDADHTLLLGLLGAMDHPGLLNKWFNELATAVVAANARETDKVRALVGKAEKARKQKARA